MADLVERDGLTYKKFTDVPFTGEVDEELWQGDYKNGKQEGPWVFYHKNGQLRTKGNYKNGEWEGPWIWYYKNGQLKSKGDYKNGKREGSQVMYHKDGRVDERGTGTFKNGKKISD